MTRVALAMIVAGALDAASIAGPAEATWIRQRLDSGLVVLAQENPAAPAVAVSVLVRVGSRWESDDNAGITNLLQQVLVKGTTSRSAFDIAEAAEAMGGSLSASGDTDYAEIKGTASRMAHTRFTYLEGALGPDSGRDAAAGIAAGRDRQ